MGSRNRAGVANAFASDADGRLTVRPDAAGAGYQRLEWDHLGRLTKVRGPSGISAIATYSYDPLDRLRVADYGGSNRVRFRYQGLTTSAVQTLNDQSGAVIRNTGTSWGGELLEDWTGTNATSPSDLLGELVIALVFVAGARASSSGPRLRTIRSRAADHSERATLENPVGELIQVLELECHVPEEVHDRLLGRQLVVEFDGRERLPRMQHAAHRRRRRRRFAVGRANGDNIEQAPLVGVLADLDLDVPAVVPEHDAERHRPDVLCAEQLGADPLRGLCRPAHGRDGRVEEIARGVGGNGEDGGCHRSDLSTGVLSLKGRDDS